MSQAATEVLCPRWGGWTEETVNLQRGSSGRCWFEFQSSTRQLAADSPRPQPGMKLPDSGAGPRSPFYHPHTGAITKSGDSVGSYPLHPNLEVMPVAWPALSSCKLGPLCRQVLTRSQRSLGQGAKCPGTPSNEDTGPLWAGGTRSSGLWGSFCLRQACTCPVCFSTRPLFFREER